MAEKVGVNLADLLYPIGSYYYCELETSENTPSKFFKGEGKLMETNGIADPIGNGYTSLKDSGLEDVVQKGNLRCYLRIG